MNSVTDKEKIHKEVEIVVNRRLNLLNGDYFDLNKEVDGFTNEIMDIIDSIQEKPVASKVLEDMLNAKTAAESLGISQEEHDRIVDELIYGKEPELVDVDDLPNKEEDPVSEKKCMFTKDSYTDEDRKVLCKDCEEKCESNKKEEPVDEDFLSLVDKEARELWKEINSGNDFSIVDSFNQFYGICMQVAESTVEWQKNLQEPVSDELEEAMQHNAPDNIGIDDLLYWRNGFITGAKWQKQQIIKDAADGDIIGDIRSQETEPYRIYAESDDLDFEKYKMGDKVKLIIVKED